VDLLVIAHAHSVRSLLRRSVSKPSIGLNCLADYGSLSEVASDIHEFADAVIVDPEGFETAELERFFRRWRSQKIRVVLLQPERRLEAGGIPAEVLCYPKPGMAVEWERLCEELPALLLRQEGYPSLDTPGGGRLVGIGASAGGPGAIAEVLDALGETMAELTILLVQHIGLGFEEGLLSWMSERYSNLSVDLAHDGEKISTGSLRLAPPGQHLLVAPSGHLRLDPDHETVNGHSPSIDVLFHSLCTWPQLSSVAGVLLTGMGRDGAAGLKEIRHAGGLTLVQDAESSIVYGMPRVAMETGAAEHVLNPAQIGAFLRRWIGSRE